MENLEIVRLLDAALFTTSVGPEDLVLLHPQDFRRYRLGIGRSRYWQMENYISVEHPTSDDVRLRVAVAASGHPPSGMYQVGPMGPLQTFYAPPPMHITQAEWVHRALTVLHATWRHDHVTFHEADFNALCGDLVGVTHPTGVSPSLRGVWCGRELYTPVGAIRGTIVVDCGPHAYGRVTHHIYPRTGTILFGLPDDAHVM